MSANVDSMSYVGEEPWHGLGNELPPDPDTLSVYRLSGLDWNVALTPVFTELNGERIEVPDARVVMRLDTEEPLGQVSPRYEPIQNREVFELADTVASETPAQYETAGALGCGEEVFVLMRFPKPLSVEGDPEGTIERYFLLRSSHDGSHALETRFTPVRVVCQNTLNLAVRGSQAAFSIRHTDSAQERIQQVKESLSRASQFYEHLGEILQAWTQRPLELGTFIEEVADPLFPVEESEERSGKAQADYERLIHLYENGEGMNRSIQGTQYGALQAVTEFADHAKTFRSSQRFDQPESRMRSILDGSARRFKQCGFRLIEEAA